MKTFITAVTVKRRLTRYSSKDRKHSDQDAVVLEVMKKTAAIVMWLLFLYSLENVICKLHCMFVFEKILVFSEKLCYTLTMTMRMGLDAQRFEGG